MFDQKVLVFWLKNEKFPYNLMMEMCHEIKVNEPIAFVCVCVCSVIENENRANLTGSQFKSR
jgi:hypothetical protein